MMKLLYVHFSHRHMLDSVANQYAQRTEAKNDKEYVLLEGLNLQIE